MDFQFAFVRLEKIAEDYEVPLENVVNACQELGIPTIPIDLGDGRAVLLCATEHENQLCSYLVTLEDLVKILEERVTRLERRVDNMNTEKTKPAE